MTLSPLKISRFPACLLILCGWISLLSAQENPPPGSEPGPENKFPDGKPGRLNKFERGPRPNMQQPFLMAGDPRFHKMLLIALAPPEQVKDKLAEWPEFQKMDEDKQAKLTQSIDGFRERIQRIAHEEADHMGLRLSEERKEAFVRAYWEKRIAAEEPIRKEVEEKHKAAMQAIREELKKEFQ